MQKKPLLQRKSCVTSQFMACIDGHVISPCIQQFQTFNKIPQTDKDALRMSSSPAPWHASGSSQQSFGAVQLMDQHSCLPVLSLRVFLALWVCSTSTAACPPVLATEKC